ncbi:MAG: GDP-mannose 4,6-dehydratase [Candidatus Dependentiae bacterium]|nr:GDP-mannose 4,6-dehydratase [Candidatus Dependentiae bacterium]
MLLIKRCMLVLFFIFIHSVADATIAVPTFNSTPKERTLFLTGAAGFIGSNFLRYMFEKYPTYTFIVLDALTYAGNMDNIPHSIQESGRFAFVHDTVTNQQAVDECMKQSDFVVHFAAESHVTRSIQSANVFVETDVMGTLTMLNSLLKHKNVERFIHISTSEVYGTAETEPMTEDHPLNPRSPYAAAKTGADRLVYSFWCTYDIPAVIIRPFNNYGPNQHIEKVIPRFITNALKGLPLTIHGDGSAKRDWVHVLDTCDALDRALHIDDFESIKNQVINIGTGVSVSVHEIATLIKKSFNVFDVDFTYQDDRPGQVCTHISSTDKAERLLGFKAKRVLADCLDGVINWHRANKKWWGNMQISE